jgi:hypothetical protein
MGRNANKFGAVAIAGMFSRLCACARALKHGCGREPPTSCRMIERGRTNLTDVRYLVRGRSHA